MNPILHCKNACIALSAGLVLAFSSGTALAHLPAAYGMEYLRADQIPPRPESALPSTASGPRPNAVDLALYRSALEEIERSRGPYAPGLTEPLNALAQFYLAQENYTDALEFFDRAIHIERINTGLNSEGLIPLLESRLIGYQGLGDVEGVAQTHKRLYRIHGNGTEPLSPDRLSAATRYLEWLRTSVTESESDNRERELLSLLQENERLIELYELAPTIEPEQHIALVLSQLRNLYLLQSFTPVVRYTLGAANEGMVPIVDQHMEAWRRRAVNRGATLLRDCLERWPQLAPLERAALMLELGDWYQWNDKWRSASEEYAKLVSALVESGNEGAIAQWLGEPAELPDDFLLASAEPAERDTEAVTMKFDLSRTGQIRRVEYIDGPEQEGYKIRRMLRDTHFRPAFKDGAAVDSEGLVRVYRLIGKGLD